MNVNLTLINYVVMVTDTEDILFSITDKVDDIDECELYPNKLCSHICVNTVGSYRCECPDGYSLHTDESTCIRDQDSRKLIIIHTCLCQHFLPSVLYYKAVRNV